MAKSLKVGLWAVANVHAAEKAWLKLACYLHHSHFIPSKCYQLFRKTLERIKQIQPTLPSLSVCPGLFSHEDNESSTVGWGWGGGWWGRLCTSWCSPPRPTPPFCPPPPGSHLLGYAPSSLSPPLWLWMDITKRKEETEREFRSVPRGDCAKAMHSPLTSTALPLLPLSLAKQLAALYLEHFH